MLIRRFSVSDELEKDRERGGGREGKRNRRRRQLTGRLLFSVKPGTVPLTFGSQVHLHVSMAETRLNSSVKTPHFTNPVKVVL